MEEYCRKHCSHGGICTLTGEHTVHSASGYCTFTDEEAVPKVVADAILYAQGKGNVVELMDAVDAILGITYEA